MWPTFNLQLLNYQIQYKYYHPFPRISRNLIKPVGWALRTPPYIPVSTNISHISFSYLLATCTFTPLYGRLCNVLGRRGANQTAVLFAGLGTLACGLSNNMGTLIAARFVSL